LTSTTVNVEYPPAGPLVWQQIRFDKPRFIQTVSILGSGTSDFANSKNWIVTVGDNMVDPRANTEYGRYIASWDRFGKQFLIQKMAQSVFIYRQDNSALQLRGFLITSTSTDCTGPFVWSIGNFNKVENIQSGCKSSGVVKAAIGDCAIAHKITVYDL
jgi:hypothetical protein